MLLGAGRCMAEAQRTPAAQQGPQPLDLRFAGLMGCQPVQQGQGLAAQGCQRVVGKAEIGGLQVGLNRGCIGVELGSPAEQCVSRPAPLQLQPGAHGCGSSNTACACCQNGEAMKVSRSQGRPSRAQLRATCSRKCTGRRTNGNGQAAAARASTASARA